MNSGEARQQVKLKVGTPGQPVDLLTPQLEPLPPDPKSQPPNTRPDVADMPKLHVDTERLVGGSEGEINFWVDPKGVRLVVVIHDES